MKIFLVILQVLVTAAVFWFLSQKIDFAAVLEKIKGISPGTLVIVAVLCALQICVASYRLRYALRAVGGNCTYLTAARSVMAGAFFGQTPLSSFGGDVVRTWTIFRGGTTLRNAASAVTLDRLFGFLGLFAIIILTLPSLWIHISDASLRAGIVIAVGFFCFGILAFMTLKKMPPSFRARFRFVDWVGQVSEEFHTILLAKDISVVILGLAMFMHLVSLFIIFILARQVGMDVSLYEVLYLTPFPLLASLLPISIGGWGVREGALIVAFGLIGEPAGKVLSASVLYGLMALVVALPGGLIWLQMHFLSVSKQPNTASPPRTAKTSSIETEIL